MDVLVIIFLNALIEEKSITGINNSFLALLITYKINQDST